MIFWLIVAWSVLLSGAVAFVAVGALLPRLHAWQVMDVPNERSSHTRATPRGGGLGLLATALLGWMLLWWVTSHLPPMLPIAGAVVVLAWVCWLDDVRSLTPAIRFVVQIGSVAIGLTSLPTSELIFGGYLPWYIDRIATGLCWLWFINLYNFMDGIDGLAATEAIAICGGIVLIGTFMLRDGMIVNEAAILMGASIGFFWWNRPPAQVFLGDVGSAPLGYMLGFLLIKLAAAGYLVAAILLPLFFISDATITLFRRLRRGERVWEPHRDHAYQRAVRGGWSHRRVVWVVACANACLIGFSWMSQDNAVAAVCLSSVVMATLLHVLSSAGSAGRS